MTIEVSALKSVRYGGKTYHRGDVFPAEKRFAKVLVAIGKVRLHTREMAAAAMEQAVEVTKPQRRYSRADAVADEQQEVAAEPVTPKPRRRYQRRDMVAEE